jgi:hypothetical protein
MNPSAIWEETIRSVIVGTHYRGTAAVAAVARLKPGDRVLLVREPTNDVDPQAVAVWHGKMHLGYLPKSAHGQFYPILGDRQELAATVYAEAIMDAKPPILPRIEIAEEPDLLNPPEMK